MIRQKETFPKNTLPLFQQHCLTEDMLLFDIETTGLSPARNRIYCIGCGYLSGEEIAIELFFAENPAQEKSILDAFLGLLDTHSTVITFNGTTFDIPFLMKRIAHWGYQTKSVSGSARDIFSSEGSGASSANKTTLSENPASVDLYREAAGMKSLLRLPSYRQKSIEQFLGCSREDKYNGGQLIEIYHRYVSHPDQQLLSLLLLHNQEDVRGMFDLLGLLSYHQLRDGQFEIVSASAQPAAKNLCFRDKGNTETENSSCYSVKFRTEYPLPQSIHLTCETPALLLNRDGGLVRFPVYHGQLKHFFSDYENYYYLPDEDYAVHKSIGAFVDSAHRRKATKKTCYSRKECDYITVPARDTEGFLRREYSDKNSYLPLPAKTNAIHPFLCRYFSQLL